MFGHDDNAQVQDTGAMNPAPDAVAPTEPATDVTAPTADAPAAEPVFGATQFSAPADPVPAVAPATPVPAPADTGDVDDELLQIKQQALQQLSPLVGHLEQTPEEKFRTTMMMIQASDNQDLIKDAYAAAQAIDDEKVRAQALLDIINEINYFTQQHQA